MILHRTLSDFLSSLPAGSFEYDGLSFKLIASEDRNLVKNIYADFRTRNTAVPITEYTEEGITTKIGKFIAAAESGLGLMSVTDLSTNEQIGVVGLTWMDDEKTKVELNRVLLRACQNKGYGTLVLKALMSLAFDHLKLDILYSENLSFNTPAQKSLENAGFSPVIERLDLTATIHGIGNYKDTRCTKYQIKNETYFSSAAITPQEKVMHPEARTRVEVQEEARRIIQDHAGKGNSSLTTQQRNDSEAAIVRLFVQAELTQLETLSKDLSVLKSQKLNQPEKLSKEQQELRLQKLTQLEERLNEKKESRLKESNELPTGCRSIYQREMMLFQSQVRKKINLEIKDKSSENNSSLTCNP